MCPNTLMAYLIFLLVAIVFLISRRRLSECIAVNFDTLGQFLTGVTREDSFFQATLRGYYKSRQVVLQCHYFDQGESRTFFIEPVNLPAAQPLIISSYPRPSANTVWKGARVYYSSRTTFFTSKDSYYRIYSQEEFLEILEELIKAALDVESGKVTLA